MNAKGWGGVALELVRPFGRPARGTAMVLVLAELAVGLFAWHALSGGLFPGPFRVAQRVVELVSSQAFVENAVTSLWLTVKGMFIAIVIAVSISYASLVPLLKPVADMVVKFRYLTITGLIFLFMMATKNGADLKLNLLLFGIVPFFVTSMMSIIADIPQAEYDLCRTLRMGPWRTLWESVVLGRLDYLLVVIQANFAIAWMMITAVEGQCMSEGGLGTLMIKSNKYLDLATIYAILILILLIGVTSDRTIGWLRGVLFPYSKTK